MAHTHGENSGGHESHGGTHGLGWSLLDSLMLFCAMFTIGLLVEMGLRQWRARRLGVRYDLTPAGRAATDQPVDDDAPTAG